MNAKEVVLKETGSTVGHACGKCGLFYSSKSNDSQEDAERCCVPKRCMYCDVVLDKSTRSHECYTSCDDCRIAKEAEKKAESFAKAKKILWGDYEHTCFFFDEEFFRDMEELEEHFEDRGLEADEWPEYVLCCDRVDPSYDADDLIERVFEDGPEEYSDRISKEERSKLQELLDNWFKSQNLYWFEINGVYVKVPHTYEEVFGVATKESN